MSYGFEHKEYAIRVFCYSCRHLHNLCACYSDVLIYSDDNFNGLLRKIRKELRHKE